MESGAVLAGRYRLDRRLGRGGMGEVWGGRDLRLGRAVAVKVLQDTNPDEEDVRRFVREAMVAAGLQHPGITVVFDADAHDGQLFIVTELLSGEDLGKVLAPHSSGLPVGQVLDLAIQLADALAAAHGRGIIHRDLKPTNLFIQADERLPVGRLKVCDFGLARDLASSSKVTRAGEIFGTPAYMAPEQWHAAATGPSVDLYAVGCILYEMLTGRVPFQGPSLPALMAQHLSQPPVSPRGLKPGIPAALDDLVLSLLAKEPANRPASATEVLAILTRLRETPRPPEPPKTVDITMPADLRETPRPPEPPKTVDITMPADLRETPRPPEPPKTVDITMPADLRDVLRPAPEPAGTPGAGVPSRLIRTFTGHTDSVSAVAFSPDGKLLATAGDTTARLWDVATGTAISTLTGHTNHVDAVAFSPDGKLLATGSWDGTARLWDVATGTAIRTLALRVNPLDGVAFSPNGKLLATGSKAGSARLWDVASGKAIRTLTGHTGVLSAVAFSPNGKLLATASKDGTARLWATRKTIGDAIRMILTVHGSWLLAVAFSPDGKLLATSGDDGTARLWDVATATNIRTFSDHTDWVKAVAFSPDGKLLATASTDRTARVWDILTGRAIRTLTGHARPVYGVAFSPDGKLLATTSMDKTARLWVVR